LTKQLPIQLTCLITLTKQLPIQLTCLITLTKQLPIQLTCLITLPKQLPIYLLPWLINQQFIYLTSPNGEWSQFNFVSSPRRIKQQFIYLTSPNGHNLILYLHPGELSNKYFSHNPSRIIAFG
jgi:hypothetical protein